MVAASEQMESDQLDNFVMVRELALDGAVRMVKGVLPIALRACEQGKVGILVPPENAAEAGVVEACKSFQSATCAKRSASWRGGQDPLDQGGCRQHVRSGP